MGVEYAVACRTCKVKRNVDKLGTVLTGASSRAEALEQAEVAEHFRCYLIASFMKAHQGHDCTLLNDTSSEFEAEYHGIDDEPVDFFWGENDDGQQQYV